MLKFSKFNASNRFKFRGILAGKSEGILNAPLNVVWSSTHDFYDLSWWDSNFNITRLEKEARLVQMFRT